MSIAVIKIIKEYKGTIEVSKDFYGVFKTCLSTDKTREVFNYVYYDKKNMVFVATDGFRLIYHSDPNFDLQESGFFTPVKIGKSYNLISVEYSGTFPNWQRVIPDLEHYLDVRINGSSAITLTGNLSKDSKTLCQIITETNLHFNIEHLTEVLKHVPNFELQCSSEENKALFFTLDGNTRYIVMPIAR